MESTQALVLAITGVLLTISVAAVVGLMLARHMDKKQASKVL